MKRLLLILSAVVGLASCAVKREYNFAGDLVVNTCASSVREDADDGMGAIADRVRRETDAKLRDREREVIERTGGR